MPKMKPNLALFILLFSIVLGCSKKEPTPPQDLSPRWLDVTEQVNGTLSTLENMRVLKLYGSYYEMGYAHGYLLGPEIFERQELELSQPGRIEFFNEQVLPNLHLFHIPDQYLEEIKGAFDGMSSRAGGAVYTKLLKRNVTLDDAIALNCINAMASRTHCSSFSAWGDMTHDGSVITGYNHDGKDDNLHTGRWIIIIRKPFPGLGVQATMCVGKAGDMNVHTVMNEMGVTLSCHSVSNANSATSSEGFTPEGLIFRQLIESVDAENPTGDIAGVLNESFATEAEALFMSWPGIENTASACAIEIDGDLSIDYGFTFRQPAENEECMIQTNHFMLRRQSSVQCNRYNHIKSVFDAIRNGTRMPLTVESAWELLEAVQDTDESFLTQHAVIFEPLKKRMHVAFAEPGTQAHSCNRVTIDTRDLMDE